jgi:hypothetical protein
MKTQFKYQRLGLGPIGEIEKTGGAEVQWKDRRDLTRGWRGVEGEKERE